MYGGYAPYQQMGQPDPYAPYGYAPQYGSFWARLAAGLADGTLMFILLIFLVIVSSPLTGQETCVANEFGPDTCTVTDAAGLWSLLVLAVWLLITMVYFAWMWRASGQTLGMRVAKIKMVSDTDPSRTISTGRAVLRVVVRTGLNLMCLGWLGSFWMLWDSQSRTWQDMAAGSRVIKVIDMPSHYVAGPAQAPAFAPPGFAPQGFSPPTQQPVPEPQVHPAPAQPPPPPPPASNPTPQRSARGERPGWPGAGA